MAKNKNNRSHDRHPEGDRDNRSIDNQQQTSQTGAQNNRGENVNQEEDRYTEDLRQSSDRLSSNRRKSS